MVCRRGDADDLTYIFGRSTAADGFSSEVRQIALKGLAEATRNRKVQPEGDLTGLRQLLASTMPLELRRQAVELAGLWKVVGLANELDQIAASSDEPESLRIAALQALVTSVGNKARPNVERLIVSGTALQLRLQAVAQLARFDLKAASHAAVPLLAEQSAGTDISPLMDAFLDRRGGPEQLAEALQGRELPPDAAKLALRYMYSVGRNDPLLSNALSAAAGLNTEVKPLTKPEVLALADEVLQKGDPARGEEVFRRGDLSCAKCHSISKAGGNVGPDLSAVGGSSPVDYVLNSILDPNQAVKEAYVAHTVITVEGKVYTGIIVDRNSDRIILRDAKGEEVTIPVDDIDEQQEAGSLMPKGLVKFLTRDELIDLARFISELGKPGEYAIRATPSLQRWRVMANTPDELTSHVPDETMFALKVASLPSNQWIPFYAKSTGWLPLAELTATAGSPVVYLYGEIEVLKAGQVSLELHDVAGVSLWVDDQSFGPEPKVTVDLPKGRHRVTLRIDTRARKSDRVRVDFPKADGSSAQLEVVGGV